MNTDEKNLEESNPYALEPSKKIPDLAIPLVEIPLAIQPEKPLKKEEVSSYEYEEPKKLRTFEDDIAEAVKGGGGSLARIAIAEQGRTEI